ncbi:MAG: deoxyribose-phosphate aldolase [Christensenellales bacterium]|jgi:deoxyribose-phosphate aldolase
MVDLSKYNRDNLGKLFDYAILPKNSTEKNVRNGCAEAKKYNCAAFYVSSPFWIPVVKEELAGTDIHPACGINFAWGSGTPAVKAFETEEAVRLGCTAVDMCLNVGAIRDGKWDVIKEELHAFKEAAQGALTKGIIEVCFLTDDEITRVTQMIAEVGLDYVKTASGQFDGPSMKQFLVMKKAAEGSNLGLKVSGVKFPRPQNAYAFLLAGADLIGTRAAPEIIEAIDDMRAIGLVPPYNLQVT